MQPFAFERVGDAHEAVATLQRSPGAEIVAGGTDMMQLLKDDVRRPERLVDINALPLATVEVRPDALVIGALARMSDVAQMTAVRDGYPVIAEALLMSASPQLRNMATIGGNLLQRTRCVYFRDIATPCNRREPGSGCSAIEGENRLHAILGGSRSCVATHPSDLAVALVALDANIRILGPAGERRLPVAELHRLPGDTPEREFALEPGEIITAIEVPSGPYTRHSRYLKVRDRASFEFALCSAAVAFDRDGDRIRSARIAAGGVGTKPWRLTRVEAQLAGARLEPATFERAAALAADGAVPLEHNRYKVELLRRTVFRALASTGALA